jgi:hypothetical protein
MSLSNVVGLCVKLCATVHDYYNGLYVLFEGEAS